MWPTEDEISAELDTFLDGLLEVPCACGQAWMPPTPGWMQDRTAKKHVHVGTGECQPWPERKPKPGRKRAR